MQETKPNKALVAIIIIVLLTAATAGTVYVLNRNNETLDTSSDGTQTTSSNETPAVASSNRVYKDGTYSAMGSYTSPGGKESIEVTLVIADGKITSAEATTDAATSTSSQYQSEFKNNFQSFVKGKSVDEIKLSRVAGSSLTSNGFNDALEQIKDKANA